MKRYIIALAIFASPFVVFATTSQTIDLTAPYTWTGLQTTSNASTTLLSGSTAWFTTFIGALTGNADTATKLATPRAINTVNFDGSAPITITAASSTLQTDNQTVTGRWNFGNATSTLITSTTAWIGTLNLTNTLTVANGGTGAATLTGCLTGNGTGAITGSGTCNTSNASVSSVAANNGITGGTITTTGTLSLDESFGGVNTAASSTWTGHVAQNTASSTQFSSATIWNSTVGNAVWLGDATGKATAATAQTCTNQFVRAMSASYGATCATVGAADVSLAALTATDSTLTFSGSYTGATARTIGLNLGNANTWTSLQTFSAASTTNFTAGSSNLFFVASTGEVSGYDNLTAAQGQISPTRYIAFKLATSTAWTATSSASSVYGDTAQIVMPFAGTFRTIACATSAGTLELSAAVNSNTFYYPASTTAGTYTSTNTFTKGQIMTVIGGNPATAPTYATCTLGVTQTP